MGRISQLFWYLNMEEAPNEVEKKTVFTHLDITDDLKKLKREYRKSHKNESYSLFGNRENTGI